MNPSPVDLRQAGERFTRRVYWEILAPALTPEEVESEEMFLDCIAAGHAIGIALADPPQTPVSAIIGYPYEAERVLLIGYMATRKALRDQGMGGQLLQLAVERWYTPDRFEVVLAEIDDPRSHPGDDAVKRVRFYDRNAAKLLARPYFQPRLSATQDRVGGMLLIALWWAPGAMREGCLPSQPIASFLHTYFAESEDGRPEDDRYAELMAAYEATPWIPARPLGEYPSIEQILP